MNRSNFGLSLLAKTELRLSGGTRLDDLTEAAQSNLSTFVNELPDAKTAKERTQNTSLMVMAMMNQVPRVTIDQAATGWIVSLKGG